jgi:outer membrane protein OmpA-like peptidoglycan-associated protein
MVGQISRAEHREVKETLRSNLLSCAVFCHILFFAAGSLHADVSCCERAIVNHFGQRGLLNLYSAHTLGIGRVALGAYGNGTLDQGYLRSKESFSLTDSIFVLDPKPAISRFNFSPFVGAGLADFVDVSLMLPLHVDVLGKYQDVGLGDLRASFKIGTHVASRTPVFDMGFLGALNIPTGSQERGYFPQHNYFFNKDSLGADTSHAMTDFFYTSAKLDFETHMLMTLDLSALKMTIPLALHLDYGIYFATLLSNDNAMLLNAGLECHLVRSVALVAELSSEMRLYNFSHGFRMNQDPLRISPALVITPRSGLMMTLGGDISLAAPSTEYAYLKWKGTVPTRITTGIEPKWRAFAQIGWSGVLIDRDRDGDGLFDQRDACPSVKEDVDGWQDDDGCPDYDNDHDGMPDSLDKCPSDAEDKDNFHDEDGCPDEDNDSDRIPDSLDKCPTVAEDFDGIQDKDGCPEYDNDADMVPDSVDKCMNIPEDIDGFDDRDGCPDLDNDQDGVPDSLDKCPDQVGPPENGGCAILQSAQPRSKAKEIRRGRVILRGVTFEKGMPTINPSSYTILDDVVASLVDWPEVQIEIQGHTDNTGNAAKKVELSRSRAETVRNYLINRGIAPTRLIAVGKGGSDPIADNGTAEGRAMNNRIELRRIDP